MRKRKTKTRETSNETRRCALPCAVTCYTQQYTVRSTELQRYTAALQFCCETGRALIVGHPHMPARVQRGKDNPSLKFDVPPHSKSSTDVSDVHTEAEVRSSFSKIHASKTAYTCRWTRLRQITAPCPVVTRTTPRC